MIRLFITLPLIASAVAEPAPRPIQFSKEIRPILSENCFFCHGPDEKKREAGLRLDDETSAKKNNDGTTAVVPGHPEKSALLERIVSKDADEVMPPPKQHKTISPAQIALLTEWIKQGAPWGKHWSYEKVVKQAVPAGSKQPVDAFLL
uniref:c-type cytochrome domain-containing protein n=1 Tax=Prosthecobacter sp. TaxID=1965333 RepID=UPI0037CB7636